MSRKKENCSKKEAEKNFLCPLLSRKKELFLFFLFRQAGEELQTFFGAGFHAGAAENAAESFKLPLLGIAADLKGVGGAFSGAKAAENALVLFDDQFPSFDGKGFTLLKGVVPRGGTFDQIAENIFEYGKKTHFNAPYS